MRITGAAALGLIPAFIGQVLGFVLAGAGEGWVTPLWCSFVLWIAYPFVLARAASSRRALNLLEWVAVAVALLSDIVLAWLTYREGINYVRREVEFNGLLLLLWAALWFGWQIVAVRNLVRARAPA